MSDLYTEKDDETTLSIFNKRVIYDFDSQNANYSNLTDFNFGEKFLYGRVSRNFKPIYFNNDFVQLKNFSPTNTQGTPLQAINFVVDMFERLKTQFDKCLITGKIDPNDPFLSSLKVYKGFQDPVELHGSFLQTYLGSIGRQLNKSRYESLDQFMVLFEGLVTESLKLYPITFAGFVKSRFCPITVSGLAIEIADSEYFNDNNKIEQFTNSPNWEFYLNACRSYGFMIDKYIPWRLVADIGTSECLEYSNTYNLSTTNEILFGAYARTDLIFFNKLKFYLLNLYNQNAKTYPESYDCDGIQKTRYIKIPNINIQTFDKQISEEQMLNLYFKIRILEEDKQLTEGQNIKLRNDCLQVYQIKGLSRSLSRFETIINQPFDSPGSISYINERAKKKREDV
tara:strand:- start:302 stop:1492 length:1191 start_codon:yes stop_codon:yes gene_type:complete